MRRDDRVAGAGGERRVDEEELDLEALLAPVDGGAGADPRLGGPASALYLGLKDARSDARDAERQAVAAQDAESPPLEAGARAWRRVAELGVELLAVHAKDLEVAGWLTEAWLRELGFGGLARGLCLMASLVERYWALGLWPAAEEGETDEDRLAPLFGLLGRDGVGALVLPVRMLPLATAGNEAVALWDIELAQAPAARPDDADTRERLNARRAERIEAVEQSIRRAAPQTLRATYAGAVAALAELERLVDVVDRAADVGRFGSQLATPLVAVREALEARVAHLLADVADADSSGETPPGGSEVTASARPASSAADRASAFATVLQAADFFERTEPQSLVGRSLREVVRRAQLPLDELLAELLPEPDLRAVFFMRAGVRTAQPQTESY